MSKWIFFIALLAGGQALANGPTSNHFTTKQDVWKTDIERVQHLANAISWQASKLQFELYGIGDNNCFLNEMNCFTTAQTIMNDINRSAHQLHERTTLFAGMSTRDMTLQIEDLRTNYFNSLAQAQWLFLQQIRNQNTIGSSKNANITCQDLYNVY